MKMFFYIIISQELHCATFHVQINNPSGINFVYSIRMRSFLFFIWTVNCPSTIYQKTFSLQRHFLTSSVHLHQGCSYFALLFHWGLLSMPASLSQSLQFRSVLCTGALQTTQGAVFIPDRSVLCAYRCRLLKVQSSYLTVVSSVPIAVDYSRCSLHI